uniref:Uncharacterized protein n=1 Tax=Coccidioides posadasii RMSCC 3488 TaxID=454284 RepID=A0A0J6I569_COCPO|nr:hypothetical protein CPAG_02875 [Coccidioides posadasii RMSCC 3488]
MLSLAINLSRGKLQRMASHHRRQFSEGILDLSGRPLPIASQHQHRHQSFFEGIINFSGPKPLGCGFNALTLNADFTALLATMAILAAQGMDTVTLDLSAIPMIFRGLGYQRIPFYGVHWNSMESS